MHTLWDGSCDTRKVQKDVNEMLAELNIQYVRRSTIDRAVEMAEKLEQTAIKVHPGRMIGERVPPVSEWNVGVIDMRPVLEYYPHIYWNMRHPELVKDAALLHRLAEEVIAAAGQAEERLAQITRVQYACERARKDRLPVGHDGGTRRSRRHTARR